MLSIITSIQDPLLDYVKDDPVRPEIPREFRVARNRFVSALVEDVPTAMVCVNLLDRVPSSVDELGDSEHADTAVFYTIWSYISGAGRDMILETRKYIEETNPNIKDFVTYSPKTEMAKRFHLKNGACTYRENEDSVNYKY